VYLYVGYKISGHSNTPVYADLIGYPPSPPPLKQWQKRADAVGVQNNILVSILTGPLLRREELGVLEAHKSKHLCAWLVAKEGFEPPTQGL
jgi:hypothetical protein